MEVLEFYEHLLFFKKSRLEMFVILPAFVMFINSQCENEINLINYFKI